MKQLIDKIIEQFDTLGISIHQMPNAIGMWENEQECLLWLLLNSNKDQDWLEIGAFCGGSAALMCFAKREIGGAGKIVSVDNDYKPVFDHNIYTRGKFQDIHTKIVCDSSTLSTKYNNPVSVAFIDGFHSFRQVVTDFRQIQSLLDKDSYIAFHDLSPDIHNSDHFEHMYERGKSSYDNLMNSEFQDFYLDEAVAFICKEYGYKLIDIPVQNDDTHFKETQLLQWVRSRTSPFNSFGAIKYEG